MTRFELKVYTAPRAQGQPLPRRGAPKNIALFIQNLEGETSAKSAMRCLHVYTPQEQYPLGTDRFIADLPNLFIDALDILDGNNPFDDPEAGEERVVAVPQGRASSVTLRSLAQNAARAAADGSGNARRFKDARALWEKLNNHVVANIVHSDDAPILEVRKKNNWKKNQPLKNTPADPQAWFVSRVYSRSNPHKDAVIAYRGFDALLSDIDSSSPAAEYASAFAGNLIAPTYAEISELVEDSNMLVFHNDQSFAEWIREESKAAEFLFSDTPVNVLTHPDNTLGEEDPAYLPVESTEAAGHLANVLAPRE